MGNEVWEGVGVGLGWGGGVAGGGGGGGGLVLRGNVRSFPTWRTIVRLALVLSTC